MVPVIYDTAGQGPLSKSNSSRLAFRMRDWVAAARGSMRDVGPPGKAIIMDR
jgi:hypothetical protein